MKKYIAPLGLIALLLAGCSSPTPADAPEVEPAAGASSEAAPQTSETPVLSEPSPLPEEPSEEASATPTDDLPEGTYSPRGNLVLTPGEGAAVTNSDGVDEATFVVNSITVDAPCTEENQMPPENGHFITLDVAVGTLPVMGEDDGSFYMDPTSFKIIGANGTTSNLTANTVAGAYCYADGALLPSSIGPGEKAVGLVVLDVEAPSGVLVFNDFSSMYGWEWAY